MATKRLRVSRPGLPSLNQGEEERAFGNKRGPLPNRGNNQGLFTPDVANRFNQARTEGGFFPSLSEDSGGSGVPLGGSRPKIPAKSDAIAQKEASEAFARARAAALAGGIFLDDSGNPIADGSQGSSGRPVVTPNEDDDDFLEEEPVVPVAPTRNEMGQLVNADGQHVDEFGNVFQPTNSVFGDPEQADALSAQIDKELARIVSGTFDETRASAVVDPATLLPTEAFQMPEVDGQQVFYGTDLFGQHGYGTMQEVDGQMMFVLADGEIQNIASGIAAAVSYASQFFIGTDEAARDTNLELIKAQVGDFLATRRDATQREFETKQNEANRNLQERLQRIADKSAQQRDKMNNEFTRQQNAMDRALQTAQFERRFALESADFALAQKRFQQETKLQNAQFALTLFQSISSSPEMLHMLQSSGLVQQFQQIIPGFNIAGFLPPLAEGAEAVSRLAEADLPSLRELQSLPADVQTDVLVSLAIQTGVKRETIVAEIQRRASGQGLASGQEQTRRIPA